MVDTGYAPGSPSSGAGSGAAPANGLSLERLKKDYLAYLGTKSAEIKEQQDARRYYHGSQWTAAQINILNDRKQPVVTYNRIARKLNALVGWLDSQRSDPRGFPRTPKHEEGAEIATAVLRYVLDEQEWPTVSPECGLNSAVDGLAGIELNLERGDLGDVDVGFDTADPASFFYDPRSLKPDFSDARYMGIGKWADVDMLVDQFPDKADEINASIEAGSDLTSNPDSDQKWLDTADGRKRIRVVDHWYIVRGEWHWCVYTGSVILAEGVSPFHDEKKRTFCKYVMFSASIDQDGDRYGFVRNMKSSQDEVNQRRSKGLHIGNSRRVIVRDGEGLDVEKIRREAVRPDGVIVVPPGAEAPEFDDANRSAEMTAQLGFLEEAKNEIENYGFNPALMGTGVQGMSGRAIALNQSAGIAELGPFRIAYRGWKLRVYRAIWNIVREHWTAERWIRVTDDEGLAKFFAVNQLGIDPRTGAPAIVNQLGALDVDIILDEGPDTVNMAADTNENVREALRSVGPMLTPPVAQAALEVLIDTSPMPASAKKKFREAGRQKQVPDPLAQINAKLELEGKKRDNDKTAAETAKIVAETRDMGADRAVETTRSQMELTGEARQQAHEERMARMAETGRRIELLMQANTATQPQQPAA